MVGSNYQTSFLPTRSRKLPRHFWCLICIAILVPCAAGHTHFTTTTPTAATTTTTTASCRIHPPPFVPFHVDLNRHATIQVRGGATTTTTTSSSSSSKQHVYDQLAKVFQSKFEEPIDRKELTKTLLRLASSQQALKGLDGVAHEAYQRTHSADDVTDAYVPGRAQRSVARMAATAEALLACELVELLQSPPIDDDGTGLVEILGNRQVVLNMTAATNSSSNNSTIKLAAGTNLSVLVLYEPNYSGGAGLDHGSIDILLHDILQKDDKKDTTRKRLKAPPRGRLLIVLGDSLSTNLVQTIQVVNQEPRRIKLSSGLVTNEVASVHPTLYKTAGKLLHVLEPVLRQYNTSAVHFVGHSLAGGVASLAATMLDGTIPVPKIVSSTTKTGPLPNKTKQKESNVTTIVSNRTSSAEGANETTPVLPLQPLSGLGRGRSSALSLGAPPVFSSNVVAAFCSSIMFGDDIVCRTTQESMQRLYERMHKNIHGGIVGRNLGWMTDTLSLTVSSLKSHAHGSEGEEVKLAIPGRAYLIRPRRYGGHCSIHEVGHLKKGGREALRARLLWQLNDILLSSSMWKHHQLDSYIHGLDRIQLRGIGGDDDDDDDEGD